MKNWLIPLSIFLLFLLSILTLMSIAPALAPKQLIFFIVGFAIFFLVSKIQFNRILKLGTLMYLLNIAFLIVVLVLAPITRGSARWIDVGGLFSIQPSQLAIPTTALFLINYFAKKSLTKFKNLINFIILSLIPGILILIEPDLGTTLVFLASISIIIYLSETKLKHTVPIIVISFLIAIFSWFFVLHQYQKDRVISFISPSDTQGISYNAIQSIIAVGSGNLSGKGIGQGIQSHLRFLPERQTDFIFASFAEEFGFIGSIVLIFLYLTLILTTISTSNKSEEQTEKLFCNVIVVMTTMQIGVNIGMNIGILPITGITLPFMSYGGSSIISLMSMFGVVQTIRLNQKQKSTLHIS